MEILAPLLHLEKRWIQLSIAWLPAVNFSAGSFDIRPLLLFICISHVGRTAHQRVADQVSRLIHGLKLSSSLII